MNVKTEKPKTGDLVRVTEAYVTHICTEDDTHNAEGYIQNRLLGVISECVGTNCAVEWINGMYSMVSRTYLEVLS